MNSNNLNNQLTTTQSVPNDPSFGLQWNLHNSNNFDIDAPEAWDITKGSNEVVIAVIDTGVNYNHPDLMNNIWVNSGEIPGNAIDDDGNGYIDDYRGYDFLSRDADPMDTDGHGTHVAGIIAAQSDNGIGISGIAPHIKIMPIRAVGGTTLHILQAINYVNMMQSRGVNIVATNNSYAFSSYNDGIRNAIAQSQQQGILFVASAGNSGANNDVTAATGTNSNYPAVYDLDNIISVASTTSSDTRASTSSYGLTTVDLGAPGNGIYSTVLGSGYGYKSGTSMAAPHVTGVVGLLASQFPTWTAAQIKNRILNTVDPVSSLTGITVTGGRLNAYNALTSQVAPIGISISNLSVNENVGNANLTVNLSRASAQPITVNYATQNGTAVAVSDYNSTSGTLTIPANQTSANISVPIVDNTTAELNETFSVNLSNPSGGFLSNNQSVVTITDNDQTTPRISVGDVSANEGNSGSSSFYVRVSLNTPSVQSVSVVLKTANGTATTANKDYTAVNKTLTFNPGQTQLTQIVRFTGDTVIEPDETFKLVASSPVNATILDGEGTITTLNDDGVTPTSDEMSHNFLFNSTPEATIKSEIDAKQYLGTASGNNLEDVFKPDSELFSLNSNLMETKNELSHYFSSAV